MASFPLTHGACPSNSISSDLPYASIFIISGSFDRTLPKSIVSAIPLASGIFLLSLRDSSVTSNPESSKTGADGTHGGVLSSTLSGVLLKSSASIAIPSFPITFTVS